MAGTVRPSVPLSVILAAANGDESALAAVLSHYQGYIRFLSMRPMKDAYGNFFCALMKICGADWKRNCCTAS